MDTNAAHIIPSNKIDGQPMTAGWPKVIERIRRRMEEIGRCEVEHFTPHDLRRTMRSHVEDHGVTDAIAELMLNHTLPGLKKRYNRNKRAAAMAESFRLWETGLANMARKAGVADALDVPSPTIAVAMPTTPQPLP